MRALLIGLVGLVTIGGAQAAECRVDGASFKVIASDEQPAAMPGLAGSTFRVVKASSKFTEQRNPSNGDITTPGELHMLLKGKRGTYLVTSFYAPGSVPASAGVSDTGSTVPPVRWGTRDKSNERKFSLASDFSVLSGPLRGYDLKNLSCR